MYFLAIYPTTAKRKLEQGADYKIDPYLLFYSDIILKSKFAFYSLNYLLTFDNTVYNLPESKGEIHI